MDSVSWFKKNAWIKLDEFDYFWHCSQNDVQVYAMQAIETITTTTTRECKFNAGTIWNNQTAALQKNKTIMHHNCMKRRCYNRTRQNLLIQIAENWIKA